LEQLAQRLRSEHGVRVIEGLDLSTSGSGTALKQHVDAHGIVVEAFVVSSWQCLDWFVNGLKQRRCLI
jgi:hypothetical protein